MSDSPQHIIFIGAFVIKDKKILLGKRSKNEGHLPGYWAVPGGKVEHSENELDILQKTATQEVLEETGVAIEPEMFLLCNNSFIRTDGKHVVGINFLCSYKSGAAKPLEDTEEVAWVSKDELDDYLIEPNSKRHILMAFEKERGAII